ncbi:MAG: UDP-N-acetylglucosamine--N-acetylmuramyl-(pentapeptide) pyrophosphoryl-undecaprenol N-acetylglucosamine transferase [Candidatus Omnitrophota bacterium]|nr:UDP-N-acetylglucosamine--N-acetylmuramyl-(pentapeptide) pyrophosphoryl-undecaprenol N-acetylglucosamine transferase [Candidatus Omnitrophota bacterium]
MKVLVVTGSSGGHIYPALGFLNRLRSGNSAVNTLLVLPRRSKDNPELPAGYQARYISTVRLKLALNLECVISCWRFLKGAFQSLILLLEFKPDVAVGFGSVDSLPIMFCAWLFREKTIIHEQNVIPGKANRLLAKFTDRVAVSFPATKNYFRVNLAKIVVTGNPLSPGLKKIERAAALSYFGFSGGKFTVLVMGGSQGSRRINGCFMEAVADPALSDLQIIHICGAKDFASLSGSYKNKGPRVKLFSYFKEMQYAYSAADLAVSRAGAATVSELIYFQVPAILIPYPYACQHQLGNAEVLAAINAAVIFKDGELSAQKLGETLLAFIRRPEKLKNMREGFRGFSDIDAAGLLVEEVLSLGHACSGLL